MLSLRSAVVIAASLSQLVGSAPVTAQATKKSLVQQCYDATLVGGADADRQLVEVCTRTIAAGGMNAVNRSVTYSNRCLGYLRLTDLEKALADCDEAVRLDPKHAYALDNRGDVYREKKQYDRAIVDFNAAIKVDPSFVSAYVNRARTFEDMGNLASARADVDTVLASTTDRLIDKWARREAAVILRRLTAAKKP
jgi:tetratricopeptide (TPR) repeat protein